MAKIYVIASGKGGTGKTTTAVNLGAALNRFREDVVIVDTNLTTPNINLHFGAPIVPVSLNHVLQGKASVEEAVYEHESGIKIVPCSLSLKDLKNINPDFKHISKQLKKIAEHIIFDSAAGLGDEARQSINAGDEIIVVTNPNILAVTDALKTIKLSQDFGKEVKGVIITRVQGNRREMSTESIKEMLEVPVLGIVPEDKAVPDSLNKKDAVIHTKPSSKAAKAYRNVAAKLLGKQKLPESLLQRMLSVLGLR
jgi:septum site-determining protein MinD